MKGWEKDPKKGLRKKKCQETILVFIYSYLKKKEKKKERDSAFIAV